MLKKIAIAIALIILGIFIHYKFWLMPKIEKNLPMALSQMQEAFEDMCNKNEDKACLQAVRKHYQKCSFRHMPRDLTLSSLDAELNNYLNHVHSCIESESTQKLPTIWDYWGKYGS